MYPTLVALHSWMRWLVLISLLFALYRAYTGWLGKKTYTRFDNSVRNTTVTFLHIQFLLGLGLYFVSPLVDYFLHHFKEAMHERQARFFGLEHIFVMLLSVVIITIGSAKAKRKRLDKQKFKTLAIWFTIGLLLILSSIPWPFSPLISRPWVRLF
ncbi:MAG: hypothetical protein INR73_21715 [Williamsia sp.]|nr:hypothetical protein [Williamsia sp.]